MLNLARQLSVRGGFRDLQSEPEPRAIGFVTGITVKPHHPVFLSILDLTEATELRVDWDDPALAQALLRTRPGHGDLVLLESRYCFDSGKLDWECRVLARRREVAIEIARLGAS